MMIPHTWHLVGGRALIYPHIAAVISARDLLMKLRATWAVAGPCGCPAFVLGPETTRREAEDWALVTFRASGEVHQPPAASDPGACLAWIEARCLDLGMVPSDPDRLPNSSHVHGPHRSPPRDRQGWLTAAETAWALLPDPLVLRDLGTGQRWHAPDPLAVAVALDDCWPSTVPGVLPALADLILGLVRGCGLVPERLPPRVRHLAIQSPALGPHAQRELVRVLRRVRTPQPPKPRWAREEQAAIRRYLREARLVHPVKLLPGDFERDHDGGIVLDGLPPAEWITAVRAAKRPAPDADLDAES
ncbi:hypothetical protein MYK68_00185 [Gordonia sp. PP30]|uniref:hypothetical protein n=1 Tax=Gordonia sp. PP30 TaxID=2935861 RepID=UPI001FFE80D8|nr:hypothetical protein [Gordonia sp. PP30]UQE75107.1 hypothetical protein MYK68_00185 [Gordonia sp. PP30]